MIQLFSDMLDSLMQFSGVADFIPPPIVAISKGLYKDVDTVDNHAARQTSGHSSICQSYVQFGLGTAGTYLMYF